MTEDELELEGIGTEELEDIDLGGLEGLDIEGLGDVDLSEVTVPEVEPVLPQAATKEEAPQLGESVGPKPARTRRTRRATKATAPEEKPAPVVNETGPSNLVEAAIADRIQRIESGALVVPGGEKAKEAAVVQLRWVVDFLSLLNR